MGRNMIVLYIVSTLRDTGPVNQLYGIICNLDREEITPYILTLSKEPQNGRRQDFEEIGVSLQTLGLSRLAFIFQGKKRLKKALQEIGPDLIHTSGIRADIALNRMTVTVPICSTIRNYVFEDYVPAFGFIKGRLMGVWHQKALKKMKYPICCSKTLKEKYEKHLKREFFAIQNGVDTEHYDVKGEKDRLYIKKKLQLPLEKKIIIVVGSLIERKSPTTIIQAVEQMPEKDSFCLFFVGDGKLQEKLQQHETDCISFLGHKNNVSEYFQAADLFISASKSEGLPNTVLEAGACGLPMILSDISQHKEIFEEANLAGVDFFHTGNAFHLAEKIAIFLKECGNYSRTEISQYVKEKFDSRIMSNHYQSFYRKCIEEADQS